jgi:predicted amidohydrolase
MTTNRAFKRRVRARAAATGEPYTAALRHFREMPRTDDGLDAVAVRLAVARGTVREDPRDADGMRASGHELRALMADAREAGARIVHFTEGAICFPSKRSLSVDGPERVGPADWSRFRWDVSRRELTLIADCARDLGIWTVLGAVHALTAPRRPHNSLYVISDRGELVTRYDERLLSKTKVSFMYTPGTAPVTFELDGLRFGCALGLEVHFAEIFAEYERLGVDCVLVSTTGGYPEDDETLAVEARGHAALNSYPVSVASPAHRGDASPCGVIGPRGQWLARCPAGGAPGVVVADLVPEPSPDRAPNPAAGAVGGARAWRRVARAGVYQPYLAPDDPRRGRRTSF